MEIRRIFPTAAMLIGSMLFTSCLNVIEGAEADTKSQVEVSFTGFRTQLTRSVSSTTPGSSTAPGSSTTPGFTPASSTRALALEDTSVKRITFAVFDQDDSIIESITQSDTDPDFGQIKFLLPNGTYTFVAVAHGIKNDNVGNATIRTPHECQLPESTIFDTYSLVEEHTIASNQKQHIVMELQQAAARIVVNSDDIVPDFVKSIGFNITHSEGNGEDLSTSNLPLFDPTTGLTLRPYNYTSKLLATVGDVFHREFYILLATESADLPITLTVYDTSSQVMTDYTRQLPPQPFRKAYTTSLTGTIFSSLHTGSFIFNGQLGELSGTLEDF